MANRAYLVTLDRPETNVPTWINDDDRRYFDSRWTLPLAWLFFFEPENLVAIDEDHWGTTLRFVANRQEACAYFAQKRGLIEQIVADERTTPLLDFLYQKVLEWPGGELLVIDPHEVWQSGADEIVIYRPLLEAIADPQATADFICQKIASVPYSYVVTEFSDSERFEVHLIGYTYW
nr:hypothetical protein [Armatimonas sp.]